MNLRKQGQPPLHDSQDLNATIKTFPFYFRKKYKLNKIWGIN